MRKPNVIPFPSTAAVIKYGDGGDGIIAEVMTISPSDAAMWLKCNRNNRPVRKRHVTFLAAEILNGNWQVNGQAIVIADNEEILDGQHRLMAIIEAGKSIQTLVVYGITPQAFRTIDTGAVRTGADALSLHFTEVPVPTVKACATAVQWCNRLEYGYLHNRSGGSRLSNTDVIEYLTAHPSMIQCAETLQSFPRDGRPLSLGLGTALYEMFWRKHQGKADEFMQRFYTGEGLHIKDVEYILRNAFIRNSERTAKLPDTVRMRMVIKAWNWLRRGQTDANKNVIAIRPDEDQKVRIF